MQFSFDDEQIEFRSAMRDFADKECTVSDLREAWESDLGWSRTRWSDLAEIGVVGLSAPEAYGGLEMDTVLSTALLEEAGRAGLPEPLMETMALGVPLLASAKGPLAGGFRDTWMQKIVSGDAVVTVGLSTMPYVPVADAADLLLLESDGSVHAIQRGEVTVTARRTLDGARRLGQVEWTPSASTLLAQGDEAKMLLGDLRDRAAVASAALLLGITDKMIAVAAEYAGQRQQFGRPIGSFQAVKHHLANALVKLEFAKPVVYRAALSLSKGESTSSRDASAAKAQASDAAVFAARVALQVHGAIGYTWEHDLHLWAKRAWSLSAAWGDARMHRAQVLKSLLVHVSPA